MREQEVHLAEATPGNAAETQAAGLVGGEEDAVGAGVGTGGRVGEGDGVELLDAVDFAVEEGGDAFVVGGDCVGLEGCGGEDRGAEDFAAGGDAGEGERDDVLFDGVEESWDDVLWCVSAHREGKFKKFKVRYIGVFTSDS